MKKLIFVVMLSFLLALNAFAQSDSKSAAKPIPANYKSDGCTWFPDGDYRDCCVAHDDAYYTGGSWKKRLQADKRLYVCVANKEGAYHKIIAPLMWLGVRVGGVSFLPTSFRWGFGRTNKRKPCRQNRRAKIRSISN